MITREPAPTRHGGALAWGLGSGGDVHPASPDAPDQPFGLQGGLDVQILYRPDQNQMTIWATTTDATPQAIQDLLDDPPH